MQLKLGAVPDHCFCCAEGKYLARRDVTLEDSCRIWLDAIFSSDCTLTWPLLCVTVPHEWTLWAGKIPCGSNAAVNRCVGRWCVWDMFCAWSLLKSVRNLSVRPQWLTCLTTQLSKSFLIHLSWCFFYHMIFIEPHVPTHTFPFSGCFGERRQTSTDPALAF